MNDQTYVYFLPRTDNAAEKKKFLLIQRISGFSAMISEAASLKEAVSIIRNIRHKTPWFHVIIDTDSLPGRDLLTRVSPLFPRHHPTRHPTLFLAQLFQQVKARIPENVFPVDGEFVTHVTSLLFSRRNQGGRRPCTGMDVLLAQIAVESKKDSLPAHLVDRLYRYPLCAVPKFFMTQARQQGLGLDMPASEFIREINALAGSIAKRRQSPFPVAYHNWLFDGAESASQAELKSRVDDFIFRALDGTTSQREKCSRHYPVQTQIVRRVDRFLNAVSIENASIFCGSVAFDRYERIRGFLELVLETWSMTLYADHTNKPQIVNLSRLDQRHHAAFAQAATAL